MKNWIHWLWQQWEWEGDLSPELTREIVQVEEALLSDFTPEQRQLYEALEEVRARRDLREQESVFRAGVLLGGGLVAEILGRKRADAPILLSRSVHKLRRILQIMSLTSLTGCIATLHIWRESARIRPSARCTLLCM